jgi:hypothetical protein
MVTSSMFFSLSSMYLPASMERSENPEKLAAESTLQPNGGDRLGELQTEHMDKVLRLFA